MTLTEQPATAPGTTPTTTRPTNWVFRDESMHMAFAFDVVETVRAEEPDLWDDEPAYQVGVGGSVSFEGIDS